MSTGREPKPAFSFDPADDDPADQTSASTGFLVDDGPSTELDADELPPDSQPLLPFERPDVETTSSAPAPIDNVQLARILGIIALILAPVILIGSRELPVPLFLLVAGLVLTFYIGSPNRLQREQVIDRWDLLIDGADGRRDDVVTSTLFRIDQQGLSQVHYAQADLAPGILRGMAGVTRSFLVVTHSGNRRLTPYRMHVNVRDYGTNLQTSWYLTYHRGFFERLKPNPLVQLDLFDEQDLRAYTTAIHHCFIDAIVDLLVALGKDTSKIDRTSKGFLGIS